MNIESQDIIRSFSVLKQMLRDRNISIPQLESYSDEEFYSIIMQYRDKATGGNIFQIKANENIKIIYHMKPKFIKSDLKKFLAHNEQTPAVEKADGEKKNHIIFIFKDKINNNNEKNIKPLIENHTYEIFPIKQLLFNVTKHSFVPKHEILSKSEMEDIQNKFSIKNKSQFPVILKSDPVARYYAMKPGDFVKITRTSTSTGEHNTYRYCV
jgi:DNA-directed RNA polymerase subunit H (RpoH/RPB5)